MTWIRETHGVQFELLRHLLAHMFDGDWGAAGQWPKIAVGVVSMLLPGGILMVSTGSLASHPLDAQRSAAMANELSLVTLLFCVTGLAALLQSQSLFPSARDYLALAGKPIRSRQVFLARFLTVLIFSTVMIAAVSLLPILIAPLEFHGLWQPAPPSSVTCAPKLWPQAWPASSHSSLSSRCRVSC